MGQFEYLLQNGPVYIWKASGSFLIYIEMEQNVVMETDCEFCPCAYGLAKKNVSLC